jgi:transcriptional regulator with XRE-family HTH domain
MTPKELEQAKLAIGTRLREARIAKGITQAELGKLAGTNQAVVQKIEIGWTLRPRMVDGLALALDVNPAWLQWGEPFAIMRVISL